MPEQEKPKQAKPRPQNKNTDRGWKGAPQQESNAPMSFEDMMNKFKQTSDEKMSDLKRSVDSKRGGFSRRGSANSKY